MFSSVFVSLPATELELMMFKDLPIRLTEISTPLGGVSREYKDEKGPELFYELIHNFNELVEFLEKDAAVRTGVETDARTKTSADDRIEKLNVDDVLEDKFEELFGAGREENNESPESKTVNAESPDVRSGSAESSKSESIANQSISLPQRMLDGIIKRYLDDMLVSPDATESSKASSEGNILFDNEISLVPVMGKFFSISHHPDVKTLIFSLERRADYRTKKGYYHPTLLDSATDYEEIKTERGTLISTTYFVENYFPEGCHLSSFGLKKETDGYRIIVNTGFLEDDRVRISLKPTMLSTPDSSYESKESFSETEYSMDALSGREKLALINGKKAGILHEFEANISANPIVLIDLDLFEPVKREIYYDRASEEYRAKIRIETDKKYFAFEAINKSGKSISKHWDMTDLEIGTYYWKGWDNFPKDLVKAAEYFERDSSPEANYALSVIFRTGEFKDDATYKLYIGRSMDAGYKKAMLDYAIHMCFTGDTDSIIDGRRILFEKIDEQDAIRNFAIGYFIETGIFDETMEDAYEYYLYSALAGDDYDWDRMIKRLNEPAEARLGSHDITGNEDRIRQNFLDNIEYGHTIAHYAMGCILYYGYGIAPDEDSGFNLISLAAGQGNKEAEKTIDEIRKAKS